jgi:glutamate carboxypeptidase
MANQTPSDRKAKLETATQWLASQQDAMEKLLSELVEASSWTYDKKGVDAASAILRQAMPLPCTSIPSTQYGNQNVFHNALPASQSGTLLIGHIDTVFPKEKFSGYLSDGKLARGPGVLDMKGGLVVMTFALQALKLQGLLDSIPLSCLVVSEEEIGSPESTPLLRSLSKGVKASLVFESGREGDAIITRRKGSGSFTAIAHGRAAHAGNAHQAGANAIWSIARFVDRIQGFTDYQQGTTLNVGKVLGGIGKNTVPDHSEAYVDMRYITLSVAETLRARILAAAGEVAVSGTHIDVEWGPGRYPMEKTDASEALRAQYAHCQRLSGLGDGECGLIGGGSDAATTAHEGIPSIDGLGPRGKGFHTVEEYVELNSLIPKTQALLRFLCVGRSL